MATKRDESQQTDRKTTLTPRQRKISPLLVTCGTITEAAEKAKVNRAAVHDWLKDEDFRREVERQRDAVTQEAFGMLVSNLTRAVEVLAGLNVTGRMAVRCGPRHPNGKTSGTHFFHLHPTSGSAVSARRLMTSSCHEKNNGSSVKKGKRVEVIGE